MIVVRGERRTEIQWLRALAASEVVVCHSDLIVKHFSESRLANSWYSVWFESMGGLGVELFFIVSGYIICMKAPSSANGLAFFMSRVRRLYPMYWIFTSLAVLTFLLNPAWRLNGFDPSLLSVLESYLILPQWGFPVLGVGWTLEHEMMFYAFVALVMVIWGLGKRAQLGVAWSLAAMGFAGSFHGPEPGYSLLTYHIFSPYMFAFGFGWLLRYVEGADPRSRLINLALYAAVGFAAHVFATETGDRLILRVAVAALIFSGFILCRRGFEADSWLNRLGWRLGDASFSIYLCHWFVLSGLGKLLGVLHPPAALAAPVRVIGIVLSIAVGVWIFAALERPIDRWLRRGGSLADIPWPRISALSWRGLSRRL